MNKQSKQKLNTNNHIYKMLIKRAYGYGDDFEEGDWIADDLYDISPDISTEELIQGLKNRLANLKKEKGRFSDAPPYKGIPVEQYLSKFPDNINPDTDNLDEISYDDYINMGEQAIKNKDRKLLEDAAMYGYYRKSIPKPARTKELRKALRDFDWYNWTPSEE